MECSLVVVDYAYIWKISNQLFGATELRVVSSYEVLALLYKKHEKSTQVAVDG